MSKTFEDLDRERTPFGQLDRMPAPMQALILQALETMAATPQIRQVRAVATAVLRPAPGGQLLDAGCGAGEAARELAALVGPSGQVTAVDISRAMVEQAAARDRGAGVRYQAADVTALSFPDAVFDGVRCERVLQHLDDQDAAVAELRRVTRPGGRVCLIDTDWTSLATDGLPDDLVDTVIGAFLGRGHGHQMAVGRTLRRRLLRAGLTDVSAEPVTICFTDPVAAGPVLAMFEPRVPPEAGLVPDAVRERWFDAVAAAGERGEFLAALTIWVAAGTA